jgi:hypothetical protein
MTNHLDVEPSVWEPCPPGEFERAQSRLELRVRRKQLAQLSGVVAVAVILACLIVQARSTALSQTAQSTAGGISCSEVQQFASGQQPMDLETREKIASHFGKCRHCTPLSRVQFAKLNASKDGANAGDTCDVKSKSHCD